MYELDICIYILDQLGDNLHSLPFIWTDNFKNNILILNINFIYQPML